MTHTPSQHRLLRPAVAVLMALCAASTIGGETPALYTVTPIEAEHRVRQRGIIDSGDTSLAVVNTHGPIRWILEQGAPVKKGDALFEMDASLAQDRAEDLQGSIETDELSLELQRAELELVRYQETTTLEQYRAELAHAKLTEAAELALPDARELQLLGIERELNQLALADAKDELQRQQRLFEKGFISKSALEPFERRLQTATIALQETELTITIRGKGIARERRLELRRAAERAESLVERSEKRMARRIGEIQNQITATEKRIVQNQFQLADKERQIASATTRAARDGILRIRTYRDWRAGGRNQIYQPGVEKHPDDVIAEVINPNVMNVKLVVNQADFPLLRVGMAVGVSLPAYPDRLFKGELKQLGAIGRDRNRVDPTADGGDPSEVTMFNAEIHLNCGDISLHPGMSAVVDILVAERAPRLLVPRRLLRIDGAKATALRYRDGRIEHVTVRGRAFNEFYYLIEEGIAEGEALVEHTDGGGT